MIYFSFLFFFFLRFHMHYRYTHRIDLLHCEPNECVRYTAIQGALHAVLYKYTACNEAVSSWPVGDCLVWAHTGQIKGEN